MKSIKLKLSYQLLIAIVISIFASLMILSIILRVIGYYLEQHKNLEVSFYIFLFVTIFIVALGIFVITFIFLVHQKLRYFSIISKELNEMANGDVRKTIELRGNDEITKLVADINYMSQQLESKFEREKQLEQEKNELVTNISHDLRTPLTSILGYMTLLKNGDYDNEQQLQDYLDITYEKSKRLERLINELFEYTRLTNQTEFLNKRTIDFAELVEQIVADHIPLFEEQQLSIEMSIQNEKLPMLIDVDQMLRVFDNLLMNAIKYSEKPSSIKVSLFTKENDVIFQIMNQVSIPLEQETEKLFERFYKVDKVRSESGGTGIGLAIVKKIVNLHAGTISAKYQNESILFEMILPYKEKTI